jgi:hypothetical protein
MRRESLTIFSLSPQPAKEKIRLAACSTIKGCFVERGGDMQAAFSLLSSHMSKGESEVCSITFTHV